MVFAVLLMMAAIVGVTRAPGPAQAAPAVAQTYYTPFEAQQYIGILRTIAANPACCTSPVISTISVTSGADGNTIVYDHFEDGYEADPLNPVQASTVVLSLDAGSVWTQTSNVPVDVSGGRGPGFYYDGRDRITSTAPIAMTQTAYSSGAGPLLAGGVQVLDFDKSGLRFDIPVGQNADYNSVFEYVGLVIVGAVNDTEVRLDLDADGVFETTVVLDEGETHVVNGGVMLGAAVESDKRVSVYLATGDIAANYESRFFEVYPTVVWSDEALSPVGAVSSTLGTRVFLFNPGSASITIDVLTGGGGASSLTVPARGQASYLMPVDAGARFRSQGGAPFFGLQAVTTEGTQTSAYDWGYALIPGRAATPSVIVPYGPGSEGNTNNYSPVWVSPNADATLYVDLDGDPATGSEIDPLGNRYDFSCAVTAFASVTIYADGTTNCYLPSQTSSSGGTRNLTGARIYTLDGTRISAAWGQRPGYVGGSPALDMGTTILPFPEIVVAKSSSLVVDHDSDGLADAGDRIRYQVTMANLGIVEVTDVVLTDDTPAHTVFVPGSVSLDGIPQEDDPDPWSPSPVDTDSPAGGLAVGAIPAGATVVVEFVVEVVTPIPFGVPEVVNLATMTSQYGPATAIDRRPLDVPPLQIIKSSSASSAVAGGDTITYTVRVKNADTAAQTGVSVSDILPSGVTFVPGSAEADIDGTPIAADGPLILVSEITLQPEETLTITFDVTVDSPIAAGVVAFANSASAWSEEYPDPVSDVAVDPAAPVANLSLVKVDDETTPLRPGDHLVYTITVTNHGPDEATGVTVVDLLPAGVTFDQAASDPACIEDPERTVTCGLGDLGVGSISFELAVTIDAGIDGTISNAATVSSETPDLDPSDDTDDEDTVIDAPPSVEVTKTPDPGAASETGEIVTFAVVITNTSVEELTITALDDDVFGDLFDDDNLLVTANTCAAIDLVLPVDGYAMCSFGGFVAGSAAGYDHLNTVTVAVEDATGNLASAEGSAVVEFLDVLPEIGVTKTPSVGSVDEPGAGVTFTVVVENTGGEQVELRSLTDSVFGDLLDPDNGSVTDNTCPTLPSTLAAGAAFSCAFTGFVAGNGTDPDHENTITFTAADDEGNEVTATADATVGFQDVEPQATVRKDASDLAVIEPGGPVAFTVTITNHGPEALSLDALTDSVFGDLLDPDNPEVEDNDCVVMATIPADTEVVCSFIAHLVGSFGDPDHLDTVTATLSDDEGTVIAPYDDAVVGFAAAGSSIGGVVFLDLDRDGLRDVGEPGIAGVDLAITPSHGAAIVVTTDGDGLWSAVVLPGSATVVVDETTTPAGLDLTTANSTQQVVAVVATHVAAADVGYGPPTGALSGTLYLDLDGDPDRDPSEPPLAGLTVELLDESAVVATTTSASDGSYMFSGLVAGPYTVRVVQATVPAGLAASADPDGGADGSASVTVVSGTTLDNLDFGHRGTGSVGDTVWLDENENGVRDAGEPPLAGARVTLLWWGLDGISGTADDHSFGQLTSDNTGHYRFEHLPPGTYTATVATGHLGISLSATTVTTRTVTAAAGEVVSAVDFGFVAADTLPLTGIDADRLLALAGFLAASGAMVLLPGWRRQRRFRIHISRL